MAGADNLLAPLARTCRCRPRMPGLLESLAQRGLNESDIDSVACRPCRRRSRRLLSACGSKRSSMPKVLLSSGVDQSWRRVSSSSMGRLHASIRLDLIRLSICSSCSSSENPAVASIPPHFCHESPWLAGGDGYPCDPIRPLGIFSHCQRLRLGNS